MMPPQDIVGVTTAVVATVILVLRIFTRLHVRQQSLDGSDCKAVLESSHCQVQTLNTIH